MNDDARERWNRRYALAGGPDAPEPWLEDVTALLPPSGRALDLAGGTGRHARWLAARGYAVTLVDVADEAIARAAGQGFEARQWDLEHEDPPPGPWDVVVCISYLQRGLFRAFPGLLAPRGVLLFAQATVRNLERHARPSRRWLLEEGELARLLPPLKQVWSFEGWTDEGTHEARVVATRGAPG